MSLPPQTYGFFMAIAFLVGIFLAKGELKRRTGLGIFEKGSREIIFGQGIQWVDVGLQMALGYFLGLKILALLQDKQEFLSDPQGFFLSMAGNPIGGIIGAIALGAITAYMQQKDKLATPKTKQVRYNVEDRIGDVLMIAIIGGVIGSKIFDAMENPESLKSLISNPISSLTSGLSVLGGLWLVSILLILYARKHKIKILPFIDSLSPAFFLSYAIGRLGCQFAGDGCWGIPTDKLTKPSWLPEFLWGQRYPHNVNNDGISISGCQEAYCKILEVPHLPTPIYESIFVTILFMILWAIRKPLTMNFGAVTGVFLVFNGLERFCIEFVRNNVHHTFLGFNFTQSQYMSIVMMLIGVILTIFAIKNKTI